MNYPEGSLEELWQIKREIASEYSTLDAYFKGFLDEQRERERQGVKFVSLPPRHVEAEFARDRQPNQLATLQNDRR